MGSVPRALVSEDLRWPVVERPSERASVGIFVTLKSEDVSSGRDRKVDIRSAAQARESMIRTDLNDLLKLEARAWRNME